MDYLKQIYICTLIGTFFLSCVLVLFVYEKCNLNVVVLLTNIIVDNLIFIVFQKDFIKKQVVRIK